MPSSGSKKPSQAAELLAEGRAGVVGQARGEALRRLRVGRAGSLDELAPAVGQRDRHRAAVLRVGLARDEAGALQAREAHAHRARRPAHLRHQLALGQRMAVGIEQGGEDLEARAREMVLGQRLLELGLEVGRGRQDAVDESGGIRLLGHLASPKGLSPSNLAKRFRVFGRGAGARVRGVRTSCATARKEAPGMESASAPARVLVVAHKTAATPGAARHRSRARRARPRALHAARAQRRARPARRRRRRGSGQQRGRPGPRARDPPARGGGRRAASRAWSETRRR